MRFRLALAVPLYFAAVSVASAQGVVRLRDGSPGSALYVATQDVQVRIDGQTATTTIEQVFRNPHGTDLEGTYLFPLPPGAAVADFVLWIGGKPTRGEVLEKGKARAIYDEIVRRKVDPALLEQVAPDLFQARVYPIPARGETRIRLAYAEVLRQEAGVLAYRFPLRDAGGAGEALGSLAIAVELAATRPLGAIDSPSHAVTVTRPDPTHARAAWSGTAVRPDRDFVLYAGTGAAAGLTVVTHAPPGQPGTFLALVSPGAAAGDAPPVPKDVVFVLDTSGSMAENGKIVQARRALAHCLGRLRPTDRFAVLHFATEATPLTAGLVPATAEAVAAASAQVEALEARGGTAIADALATALGVLAATDDRPAYLVLVTDGRATVGETDADRIVAATGQRAPARARIFTLGVGADLNTRLIDALAEGHRGAREYVAADAEVEARISAFYDKIAFPALTDCALAFEGLEVSAVCPRRLPDLFYGGQLAVMGRFKGTGTHAVRLTGRVAGVARTLTWEGDFGATTAGGDQLPRLWATRRVGFLLEEIRLRGDTPEVHAEVVRLAREHQIVTPYTSYLVVEDDARVEAPARRGGVGRRVMANEPSLDDPVIVDAEEADHNETDNNEEYEQSQGQEDAVSDKPFQGRYWNDAIGVGGGVGGAYGSRFGGKRDLAARHGGSSATEKAVESGLRWLRNHQSPDGSWPAAAFSASCHKNICDGAGVGPELTPATSSLSLLAFLGAGHSIRAGRYKEVVKRGCKYLKSIQQPDGAIGANALDQALAAMALAETYGLSMGAPSLRAPAQSAIDRLVAMQAADGGFGAAHGLPATTVLGWAVLAWKSAQLSELRVPPEALDRARAWLDAHPAASPADAAPHLITRIFTGGKCDDPAVRDAAATLRTRVPAWIPGPTMDFGYTLLGTLGMFQMGGEHWKLWNAPLKEASVKSQRRGGDEDGSWDPLDAWGATGGRIAATALNVLTLEVYYRYGKVLTGVRVAPVEAPAEAPPVPDPAAANGLRSDGADGIEAGRLIDRLKDGRGEPGPAAPDVRVVGARRFRLVAGVWTDTTWQGGLPVEEIDSPSEAYDRLLASRADLVPCFSLGRDVLVVDGARAIHVRPAGTGGR